MSETNTTNGGAPQSFPATGASSYDPFDTLIANAPSHVRSTAVRLRSIVRETLPAALEIVLTGGIRTALYRQTVEICAIQPGEDSCSLQLMRGAELADDEGLLHGDGRNIREMTFRSPEDIPDETVRRLLRAAHALNTL